MCLGGSASVAVTPERVNKFWQTDKRCLPDRIYLTVKIEELRVSLQAIGNPAVICKPTCSLGARLLS
jgi:hypothetical protein